MGRWRPPPPKSSPYITTEGYQQLEEELNSLWQRRKHVTKALSAAAAEGDRSENAEYIYRKKELREIDSRVRYIQTRIPKLKIVTKVGDQNKIFFGAWVTLENGKGEENTYRIVGPDEIDAKAEYISIDSIMSKALLGKAVDDRISVRTADNERNYFITSIQYNK